jgi:hypothetical protein
MTGAHKWSIELQDKTREILNDLDRMAIWDLLPNKSGVLKKAVFDENGDTTTAEGKVSYKYGFLKFANAVAHKWIIDLEEGGTENFESVEDLIDASWALD